MSLRRPKKIGEERATASHGSRGSHRAKPKGLDAELKAKQAAKYDEGLEHEARQWIEACTGESVDGDFQEALADGQILCNLMNAVFPGTIKKVNKLKSPFFMMENIGAFINACTAVGVPGADVFEVVDLYEGKDMNQVVQCIHALGRIAQKKGFKGPKLGVKMADKRQVDWDAEKVRKSEAAADFAMLGKI